jgi:hypothetical protein
MLSERNRRGAGGEKIAFRAKDRERNHQPFTHLFL